MTADKDRLFSDVQFLTSLNPYRNYKNISSINRAAEYIRQEFETTGLRANYQTWFARGNQYRNVIASLYPEKEHRFILGAHYDVYGDLPGADDNASGVAGLLETARMITVEKPDIEYGIDFVAYSLEEPPFFGKNEMGSFVHAQSLHLSRIKVIGMISYEMIGHYAGKPEHPRVFPAGVRLEFPDSSDKFIGVISTEEHSVFQRKVYELMKNENEKRVALVCFPTGSRGPTLSDNRNYWHFGFPALMLNDGPSGRNPNYHQKTDTIDTLDFEVMGEVVTATANAIVKL